MNILVVGKGRVGTTLAGWFDAAGHSVTTWENEPLPETATLDLVVLAVSDNAIQDAFSTAEEWSVSPDVPFVHCSGFAPARTCSDSPRPQGALHPAYSFADVIPEKRHDICFLLDGDDKALAVCGELLSGCGLDHVQAPGIVRPLYHAACVVASNFLPLLGLGAESLMYKAGIGGPEARRLIFSLFSGVLQNARDKGFFAAITGPTARGDARTVLYEAGLVASHSPDFLPLFLEGNRSIAIITRQLQVAKRLLSWAQQRVQRT